MNIVRYAQANYQLETPFDLPEGALFALEEQEGADGGFRSSQSYSGQFKLVYAGTYTAGERKGEACVSKVFKTGAVFEDSFFKHELDVVAKALQLVQQFNDAKLIDRKILVNQPEIWQFEESRQKAPLRAAHREFLLCDLHGGVYSDGVVLTDPVVMSATQAFGSTDLGLAGITTFCALHKCIAYCRWQWSRPRDKAVHYLTAKGTSLVHVPIRASWPAMTYGIRK
ncbi:hypothetical protein PhCBS80983_g05442 [Powellomyces hirtus]|uniref:Alpha-type protein kinase domain-containing protein n=1 Tax=Powellomyces hirtus TaxID=109895 RepID=A0A507DU64_9FUNG|nr:hypothetical protein PhCBS80983_g05442 [Powellomyces hirtus]